MKKLITAVLLLTAAGYAVAADITGFWQTVDEKAKEPKSVVALYEYNGKLYGRVILTYTPGSDGKEVQDTLYSPSRQTADNVTKNGATAFISGLDFLKEMNPSKGGWLYEDGFILDPKTGKEYKAKIKLDKNGDLTVKGHLKISSLLGREQSWKKFDAAGFPAGFVIPDYKNFTPDLPAVK